MVNGWPQTSAPRCTSSLARGTVWRNAQRQEVVKGRSSLSRLAFSDFSRFPACSRFCFQTQMSSSWQLASELSILYFFKKGSRHYSEVLKAEASRWTHICASYFRTSYFTSNQRALLCIFCFLSLVLFFLTVVYLLATMAGRLQLKCRTFLSC